MKIPMQSSNEIYNLAFENVILPIVKEVMRDDYLESRDSDDPNKLEEFARFEEAFKQRIKLFYFRKFLEYKKEGRERVFPENVDVVFEDVGFMYAEFKSFLKEQQLKISKK